MCTVVLTAYFMCTVGLCTTTCAVPVEVRGGYRKLWTGSTDCFTSTMLVLGTKLRSSEEWSVLLTSEPFFQAPHITGYSANFTSRVSIL